MEVILLKTLEKVGKAHEIVTVKDGYGRNYLIPYGYALLANKKNRAELDERIRVAKAEEDKLVDAFKAVLAQLDGKVLRIGAKAGTSGKIFGSVTGLQLSQALKEQVGVEIDRRNIELTEKVENLGTYTATLSLHKQVQGVLNFEVIAD